MNVILESLLRTIQWSAEKKTNFIVTAEEAILLNDYIRDLEEKTGQSWFDIIIFILLLSSMGLWFWK